jgi:transcriptional regulator with XRE-family HTH domain
MKEIREDRGLTLADLERITGIDRSTLNRYENGKRSTTIEKGLVVAKALGVSVEFLAGGETVVPDDHGDDSATAGNGRGKPPGEAAAVEGSPARPRTGA